jgi:hypothetical protein
MNRGSWDTYEKSAKKGPWGFFLKLTGIIVAMCIVIGGIAQGATPLSRAT